MAALGVLRKWLEHSRAVKPLLGMRQTQDKIEADDPVGYRSAFRPLRSGLGGEAPLRGFLKNSESGTSSVAACRSNTSGGPLPLILPRANIGRYRRLQINDRTDFSSILPAQPERPRSVCACLAPKDPDGHGHRP